LEDLRGELVVLVKLRQTGDDRRLPVDWIIILIVVPFCIGFVGTIVKTTALGKKPWDPSKFNRLQRLYFRTLAWHPVFVALPLGGAFMAFGWPHIFGDNPLAYGLAALFSSGVTIVGYALIVKTIRRMIGAAGSIVGGGGGSEDEKP
jgi:hypothetical protein